MWQLGWSWFLTNKRISLLIPSFSAVSVSFSSSFSQPNPPTYPEKSVLFPAGCISAGRICGPLPFQARLTLPCNQMFHWSTYTWESLGCTQLLVNSLPRSSGCKQNQPKKNKPFLNWVGQGRSWIQRCRWPLACWWGCREKLICHSWSSTMGFTQIRSYFFGMTNIVPLISRSLEIPDTLTPSNAAEGTLYCLQLSIHLSEFLAKSI